MASIQSNDRTPLISSLPLVLNDILPPVLLPRRCAPNSHLNACSTLLLTHPRALNLHWIYVGGMLRELIKNKEHVHGIYTMRDMYNA